MKTLKSLVITLISLAALALPALGQSYSVQTVNHGIVWVAAANTSNSIASAVMDVRKQQNVGVSVAFKLVNSGTEDMTFKFRRSLDGVTFDTATTGDIVWVVPANGSTMVYATTNLVANGVGFLKLASVGNGNASYVLTNIVVKYSIKAGAP